MDGLALLDLGMEEWAVAELVVARVVELSAERRQFDTDQIGISVANRVGQIFGG